MISEIVKRNLVPSGNYICGFADLRALIDKKYGDFHFGISIGKRLEDKIIDKLVNGPTIEYYNYYNKINAELAELTSRIHTDLLKNGVDSIPITPTISPGQKGYEKYLETLTYDISHKMVATRAGLGWIGKSDLLISNKFGPRLRLVTVLIKQDPHVISKPFEESRCGKCNICVAKCPANAANGKSWDINTFRDEFFDARKCREKCRELAKERLNVDERICGLCVCVCPIGKIHTD
jgi:epoxyqueuosine reductase QueG